MATCEKCGPEAPIVLHQARDRWYCKVGRYARTTPRVVTPATRHRYALHNKGMTKADYDALLAQQGGVCAICQGLCSNGRRLAVDHDHQTGQVRGLLCQRCNTALGLMRDRSELLLRAVTYLDPTA